MIWMRFDNYRFFVKFSKRCATDYSSMHLYDKSVEKNCLSKIWYKLSTFTRINFCSKTRPISVVSVFYLPFWENVNNKTAGY